MEVAKLPLCTDREFCTIQSRDFTLLVITYSQTRLDLLHLFLGKYSHLRSSYKRCLPTYLTNPTETEHVTLVFRTEMAGNFQILRPYLVANSFKPRNTTTRLFNGIEKVKAKAYDHFDNATNSNLSF